MKSMGRGFSHVQSKLFMALGVILFLRAREVKHSDMSFKFFYILLHSKAHISPKPVAPHSAPDVGLVF